MQDPNTRTVRYLRFSQRSDTSFRRWLEKRRNHPAKALFLDWLSTDALLPRNFTLLDVGCGPGNLAQMILGDPALRNRVRYTGIDQSADAVAYAGRTFPPSCRFLQRDVLKDGLPEEDFDVISFHEVVEHLPAAEPLLAAAARRSPKILALTGFAIIPGLADHVERWDEEEKCYKNSYAFHRIHQCFWEAGGGRPVLTATLGTQREPSAKWFTEKALTLFYLRLGADIPAIDVRSQPEAAAPETRPAGWLGRLFGRKRPRQEERP